jgi:hypothetical protein
MYLHSFLEMLSAMARRRTRKNSVRAIDRKLVRYMDTLQAKPGDKFGFIAPIPKSILE